MKKVLVLDATAFISGFRDAYEECYTTPEVLGEIKERNAKLRADMAVLEGKVKLKTPAKREILEVKKAATKSGDIALMSDTDAGLLALALGLEREGYRPLIVTDDYDIQNMTYALGIDYLPMAEKGITRILRWKSICKGCRKIYPADCNGTCDICGSTLNRVPLKKIKKGYCK